MGDIGGDRNYDAARANWGGDWRMPTKAEMEELVEKCRWEWTSQGGHNGYRVTGPNGASIFLPTAGWRIGTSLRLVGDYGIYWSSAPFENTLFAYHIEFNSNLIKVDTYSRISGFSVRPVKE